MLDLILAEAIGMICWGHSYHKLGVKLNGSARLMCIGPGTLWGKQMEREQAYIQRTSQVREKNMMEKEQWPCIEYGKEDEYSKTKGRRCCVSNCS